MKKNSTAKKIILRSLISAPIGLAITTIITIIISVIINDGNFYPVVPTLIDDFGSQINAVLVQSVCSLLYGAAWGGASVIWELDSWSLLRQTATHLIICSSATFPIAYFMHWMPKNLIGIVMYFGIFLAIYFGIWLAQYFAIKARLNELNNSINFND